MHPSKLNLAQSQLLHPRSCQKLAALAQLSSGIRPQINNTAGLCQQHLLPSCSSTGSLTDCSSCPAGGSHAPRNRPNSASDQRRFGSARDRFCPSTSRTRPEPSAPPREGLVWRLRKSEGGTRLRSLAPLDEAFQGNGPQTPASSPRSTSCAAKRRKHLNCNWI